MPLCCIGGVCIPYTAVVPFMVLGLQWLFQKLVALGIVPQSVQDKVHALLHGGKSSSSSKTISNAAVDSKKRRKSSVKASESCCSTTTLPSATSSSCCDTGDEQPNDKGSVQLIESEEDWEAFFGQTTKKGVVIVKMTATWCQPCKVIQPYYEQLAAASGGMPCAIMDVDELDEVAAQYRVAALPTFLALQQGTNTVVHRYSGSSEGQLQNFFQKIKEEFQ